MAEYGGRDLDCGLVCMILGLGCLILFTANTACIQLIKVEIDHDKIAVGIDSVHRPFWIPVNKHVKFSSVCFVHGIYY